MKTYVPPKNAIKRPRQVKTVEKPEDNRTSMISTVAPVPARSKKEVAKKSKKPQKKKVVQDQAEEGEEPAIVPRTGQRKLQVVIHPVDPADTVAKRYGKLHSDTFVSEFDLDDMRTSTSYGLNGGTRPDMA